MSWNTYMRLKLLNPVNHIAQIQNIRFRITSPAHTYFLFKFFSNFFICKPIFKIFDVHILW